LIVCSTASLINVAEIFISLYLFICMSLLYRKKFEDDGTISKDASPDELQLRIMLDEVYSQNAIGKYAKVFPYSYLLQ